MMLGWFLWWSKPCFAHLALDISEHIKCVSSVTPQKKEKKPHKTESNSSGGNGCTIFFFFSHGAQGKQKNLTLL